jgi:putative membrane protein
MGREDSVKRAADPVTLAARRSPGGDDRRFPGSSGAHGTCCEASIDIGPSEETNMSRKFLLKALPAALLALGVTGAYAQAPASPATPQSQSPSPDTMNSARNLPAARTASKLSHGDREFIEEAAKGGMAEVELGQLAQQHASSEQVRQFGARMVQDHGKANEELRQLAQEKGVTLPSGPSHMDNHEMSKLSKLTGADFDREYMKNMVKDHQKDVKEFQKQASGAKDPDVKSFAAKTLPTLQQHLQMAETANQSVGGKPRKTASR